MIRRSLFVALLAISVSVLVHIGGLTLTVPNFSNQATGEDQTDTVELGNTFEEFVDTQLEPVQPELTEAPPPPEEPPVEPREAEIPTSDARVASPDPKQTYAPDTGDSTIIQPRAPDEAVTEPVEQALDDNGESAEAAGSDTATENPEATPDQTISPVEPSSVEEPVNDVQIAALPPELSPVDTEEAETIEPVTPDTALNPLEDDADVPLPEAESDQTDQAPTSSLRPRPPNRNAQTEQPRSLEVFRNFDNLRFPEQTVESPLTAFKREGVDVFRQSRGSNRSGGRGPGNSDTTNYAGEVLVHLNRAPIVYVAARGYARVFFQIDPDGSLAWVEVVESSGSPDIERAAKEQVRTAAPFPRPPGGASRKLSFYYQIR
ncbi:MULTISPECIES: TonB family protein [unclassified Ruegeria]|uniref:TonB family protein n=1 Tax=unclassified Ruegeria TaxID=2625375 RepID=UPI001492694E|nr:MULTISPECIES: TonB family protein [unclassified Ruegeria]NOD86897.1 TonB family protein [Ruegeria sp. HKCCD4318]NOE12452.1 TonB family protein [Ruegeria sp. HKCCD4318-2]NOG09383.1 TonB family protein [Ruegeria sp. HKCCD4315]